MRCIKCNHDKTEVKDSRPSDDNMIRRRRVCPKCEKRFTTFEMVGHHNGLPSRRNIRRTIMEDIAKFIEEKDNEQLPEVQEGVPAKQEQD